MYKTLTLPHFAKAFDASDEEISALCSEAIQAADFRYTVCSRSERERVFLDVLTAIEKQNFSVSGAHRKREWVSGWAEIREEFLQSGGDLRMLVPKDVKGARPLRYDGEYIVGASGSFERDFSAVFRTWLFRKYFSPYGKIFEFGCGTGHNLVLLASLFPDKDYVGMDWVADSQDILKAVSAKYGWRIKGHYFDFFQPDYDLQLPPNSMVYTSAALEQMGSNFQPFLEYLLANKPSLCVNVECIDEYYNRDNLFDYVALKYHESRQYLSGFLTRLRQLEREGRIQIVATKRLGFGSLYHEVYSYVIWKIL